MADVAKVLMSDRSEAVHLPETCPPGNAKAEVTREDGAVAPQPELADPWANLKTAIEGFDRTGFAEWMAENRDQPPEQERPGLDELFRE